MIKVLFVCAGGISTSFLEQRTKDAFAKRGIGVEIEARSATDIDDRLEGVDVVLMAPQVSYMQKELEKLCAQQAVKFGAIPMVLYGQMNGEALCDMILKMTQN
jgi:PTS system cellobiose-specific IIB component